jgi:uncharacterized membrane protein
MTKGRLEAFSDGVLAIVITIMVLELKVPHVPEGEHVTFASLAPLVPVLLSYVLSFIHVGIYWNNHHHMLHAARTVNGAILWGNMHLLFWLSLVPFVTGWMGENHFAAAPVALYGAVMLMAGVAYYVLSRLLIAHHGEASSLATALGPDTKGKLSVLIYAIAVAIAFWQPWVALALYVVVAVVWLVPDRRIEGVLAASG